MDREHTEQTALGRTGELDHLAPHTEELNGAEYSDGGLVMRHRQSVAHVVMRK
jgi:hypothetical protein